MAMTENIVFADGNQYGYLRIYDLSERPADTPPNAPGSPQAIGRERLAEAFSGIPGKVALYSDYAVVNTSGVGIQVVNVKQAIKNQADNKPSDGSSIVGILDTLEQGYGSPNDLAIFNERSAVFTTSPGWLLAVDLNLPTDEFSIDNNEPVMPLVMNAFKPAGYSFTKIGVATGFAYTDDSGMEKSINLAVAAISQGKIVTLDLSDMTNPQILGEASTSTTTGASGVPIFPSIRDIWVSKDAGLAYVTTYNSIQVYDIKNQGKPKFLNEIKLLPDPSGAVDKDGKPIMIPIGETPALVEKGGWVYLANATKGFRALDLDPVVLILDEPGSIKIDAPMKGKAINNEVYITYTLTPQTKDGFEPLTSVLTIMESDSGKVLFEQTVPHTAGKHAIQFKAKDIGWEFDVTKRYIAKLFFDAKPDPFERSVRIPLEWQAIATDYNRDGAIDQADLDRAAAGNKYYFWINDNADVNDVDGNSIPGSGKDSGYDYDKTSISGTRDLVDYFPILLKVGDLITQLTPDKYSFVLKQGQEAVNYLDTVMSSSNSRQYLTNVDFATNLVATSTKVKVAKGGTSLDAGTIENLQNDGVEEVVLIDGRITTRMPLILEVRDKVRKDVAFRTELPLSLDGVENMFRHKNLIREMYFNENPTDLDKPPTPTFVPNPAVQAIAGHPVPKTGKDDRLIDSDFGGSIDHLTGFDVDNTDGDFVHVHGYNVNAEDSRGEQAEAFKRLYWSGSKSKFWGITWYGYDSQMKKFCIGMRSPNYHVNVRNAYNAGMLLKDFATAKGLVNATFMAHSLGNMVVSTAIKKGLKYGRYLMVNAAVAEESYVPETEYADEQKWMNNTRPMMYDGEWRYPYISTPTVSDGYHPQLWASEWYKLFKGTIGDDRKLLTWRGFLQKVSDDANVYNFYAPTDQAFRPYEYTLNYVDKNEDVTNYPKPEKSSFGLWDFLSKNWFPGCFVDIDKVGTYSCQYKSC